MRAIFAGEAVMRDAAMRGLRKSVILPLMTGALFSGAGQAIAQQPAEQCDVLSDLSADTEPSLYRVRESRARLHFLKSDGDQEGCPRVDAACETRAYLVAGDPVIVTEIAGDFACGAFTAPKGAKQETMGWLPRAALEAVNEPPAAARDWPGQWRAGFWREIKITAAAAGGIELEGTAYWGADDPGRRERGAVNTGDLSATVKPDGGKAAFSLDVNGETHPYDANAGDVMCQVRLWRLGPYLAVADNVRCGGANVTFTGIYRRGG
jgi:hypothetical protein